MELTQDQEGYLREMLATRGWNEVMKPFLDSFDAQGVSKLRNCDKEANVCQYTEHDIIRKNLDLLGQIRNTPYNFIESVKDISLDSLI